jgi:hypothetical protein
VPLHVPEVEKGLRGPYAAGLWETSVDFKGSFTGDASLVEINPDLESTHMPGFIPRRRCNAQLRSRWNLRGDYPRFDGQVAEGAPGFPQQRSLKALVSLQFLGIEIDRHSHPLTVGYCYSPTTSWCGGGRQHIKNMAKDRGGVHNNFLSHKRHNLKASPDRYSPERSERVARLGPVGQAAAMHFFSTPFSAVSWTA